MGLLMYREPESPETQKAPKSDPTAHARSSIRRTPAGRRSYILRRHAEQDSNRATDSPNLLRTNYSDVQSTAVENTGSQLNGGDSVEAQQWGVVPGSTEHQQLREVFNSTEPLSRTSQQRWRSGASDYLERVRRARRDDRQQRQRLMEILNATTANSGELPVYLLSQPTNEPPRPIPSVPDVTMSNASGLGDRRRSPSPEEATWETLRESIQADERLPSASSSFASTAAVSSASLSRERSMRSSPATSIMSGAEPALSFYPPQRNDRRIRAAHAQDATDDENFTSLFVCDSNPSSDDEQESGVSGQPNLPPNPVISTYEGTITFTTDGRMIRTPPTPARSPPHNNETSASRTSGQTSHAERRRRLHSMLAAANDPSRRSYTGPAIPRGPTPPAGRSRERSPGQSSRTPRRWRSNPLTPPPPRRAESLLAHVEAANGERSHAGRSGDDRQAESRRSGSTQEQVASQDNNEDDEQMRGSQAVRERLLNVNELHQRYAALQRQEGHLNDLIQRLTSDEDVPDALWGLAGVERQRVEHGAAAAAAAEEARVFREMREREARGSVYERLSRALGGPDVVVEVNGRPFDGLLGVQFAAEDAELERGLRQWAERRSRGEGRPFEVDEPLTTMQVSDR